MSFRKITVKSGDEEITMNVTEEEYRNYFRPWWQQKKHDQRNREAMEQNGYTEESYEEWKENDMRTELFAESMEELAEKRMLLDVLRDAMDSLLPEERELAMKVFGEEMPLLPWDFRGWHCGGGANNTHIGVEMTEPATIRYTGGSNWTETGNREKTKAHVLAAYKCAVELFAYLCQHFHLDPLADGVIISHSEGCKRGIASNHGDVEHLWSKFGLSMEQFRKDIKAAMEGSTAEDSLTAIMGKPAVTAEQMKSYLKKKNPSVPQSVLDMIPLYISEGEAEGVRGDIAFAQSCLETGKVGPEYVINETQARTVRKIFDMYLAGNGSQKIKRQLEKDGDLTAMGKSLWHYATISHILKNRLYCGELEYRKEYVPDYLEQKRAKNNGELDRIIVEGKHQPIVTKEEFEKVQKLIEEKRPQMEQCLKSRGVHSDDLWRRRLRCQCGHAFAKTRWHSKSRDFTTYTYKCYDQTRTGTISARLKNGLSIEGVCHSPLVQDWKIHTMAQKVLHAVFDDPEGTLKNAAAVLGLGAAGVEQAEVLRDKTIIEERLKKEQGRYETLLDMRMNNEIPREVFSRKQQEVEKKIAELEQQMMQYGDVKPATEADVSGKLENLRRLMGQPPVPEDGEFSEEDIDKYVFGVRVYEDRFEWLLNLSPEARGELDDAGSPVYFTKLTVTPDDERAWFRMHPQWSKSNKYAELEAWIFI